MMAMSGLIPWNAALYIIIGQNVGSCFTAVLSSLGTTRNARATAYIHLVYNALGGLIVTLGAVIFFFAVNPEFGHTAITSTNISAFHTGYNVVLIVMLFPLGGLILRLAEKMAGKEVPVVCNLNELDESIIETPKYALENGKKAVTRLTDLMNDNADFAEVDKANGVISAFLKKLYGQKLTQEENAATTQLLFNLEKLKNKAESVIK